MEGENEGIIHYPELGVNDRPTVGTQLLTLGVRILKAHIEESWSYQWDLTKPRG